MCQYNSYMFLGDTMVRVGCTFWYDNFPDVKKSAECLQLRWNVIKQIRQNPFTGFPFSFLNTIEQSVSVENLTMFIFFQSELISKITIRFFSNSLPSTSLPLYFEKHIFCPSPNIMTLKTLYRLSVKVTYLYAKYKPLN